MPTPPFLGRFWDALLGQSEKSIQTTAAVTLLNGRTVFRVNNGPIVLTQLVSYCITTNDATASTLQWSADGDVGAATTITAASASLASFIAGGAVTCQFSGLAVAPIITGTTGVVAAGPAPGIVIPAGIITTVVGVGTTTGTWLHYARYMPLAPTAFIAVA